LETADGYIGECGMRLKLCLRLHPNCDVTVDHRAAGEAPVVGLALQQDLLLRCSAVCIKEAVLDGNDASTALTTATAVAQLATERVKVDFVLEQLAAQVRVAIHLYQSAPVVLHYLHGECLRLVARVRIGDR
jgi:hypothetical protein